MTRKKDTYEPDLADLTPRPRTQGPGPSSRALDSLHERGILGAADPPSASSALPAYQQPRDSFGSAVGSAAGRTKNKYEPDLADLTPKPRAQTPGPSSSAVESLQQRGMWKPDDTSSTPSTRPVPLPVPESPSINLGSGIGGASSRHRNTYEPDLTPRPRTQEPGPSSRAVESLRQREMWSDEDAPPVLPSAREPRLRIQEPGLSSNAADALRRRGMLGDESESAPPPRVQSAPHPSIATVSTGNNRASAPVRAKDSYTPSFDPLPGAHGPPGPTPTAIEGLKKRGIWVEDDAAPSPPRRQDPEPTGPAAPAIEALKQRGIWQDEVAPAATTSAPASPQSTTAPSSPRPRQADMMAAQHPLPPSPTEAKPGAKLEAPHQPSLLDELGGELPAAQPPTPPLARTRAAARRSTTPRPRAKPAAPRATRSDRSTRATQSKLDLRAQRTIKIPCRCYAQLTRVGQRRGVSINAVILGLLADACAAVRLGHDLCAAEREVDRRVRRTIRIPRQDYDQLNSVAQQREVGINTVIIDILTQA